MEERRIATAARILVPRLRAGPGPGRLGSAQATTVSPNVSVTNLDNALCRLVHAGKETIAVHFELLDDEGQVLTGDDFDVAPGKCS